MKFYDYKTRYEVTKHGTCYGFETTKFISCPECHEHAFVRKPTTDNYLCTLCGCEFKEITIKQPTKEYKLLDKIFQSFIVLTFVCLVLFSVLAKTTGSEVCAVLGVVSFATCVTFCCLYSVLCEEAKL